jgi:hypothetical protein
VLSGKAHVRFSATPGGCWLADSPKLSGAAPPNRASRETIAFLESDRPDAPRAGDAYDDKAEPTPGSFGANPRARIWANPIVRRAPTATITWSPKRSRGATGRDAESDRGDASS